MNKTLYISDLDGTLLNKNAQISEFTEKTLNSLICDGLNFTVSTARSIISAGNILNGIFWKFAGVFMNGVLVCDINNKITLDYTVISKASVEKMIEIFEYYNRPPTLFTFNGIKNDIGYSTDIFVKSGVLKHQADIDFYEQRKNKYKEYIITRNFETDNVIYLNGMDEYPTMKKIFDEVSQINDVGCELYEDIYSGMWLLECHSKKASKSEKIKYLKEKYKFDKIVAFGDNYNDIQMLQSADIAVVVENAPDKVKSVADIIIPSNQDDGVAKYLLSTL